MAAITGVELGPDYCVLVRGARDGSRTTVSAARTIAPAEWSSDPETLVDALGRARRDGRFPSRARVVAWGTTETTSRVTQIDPPDLGAFEAAGFEIERVLSPAQALGRIVRDRGFDTDGKAIAAVALNTQGVVIAIVSNGEVISSRTFGWALGVPFSGARPELLDRYLIISEVAPQLEHIIELVRPVYGAHVASVVLCGNLPNLRSLSMLLIEEIDVEVETLDSTDLLDSGATEIAESISALQLASAASSGDEALATVLPGRAYRPAARVGPTEALPVARPAIGIAAFMLATAWLFLQVSGVSRAVPILPDGAATVASLPADPDLRAEATMGRIATEPPSPRIDAPVAPVRSSPPSLPSLPPRAADRAIPPSLPRVNGIMIAGARRLAIVDGDVVEQGTPIGAWSLSRIEREGVYLREPSGREVFVAIRTQKPGTGGS